MRGNLPNREPEFLDFWEKNEIYTKKQKLHEGRTKWVLHDGPPYANGHIPVSYTHLDVYKRQDMVIIAIKPQMADSVLSEELARAMPPETVIVSIMGSVPIAKIVGFFPGHPVIRTMPNTPLACLLYTSRCV